MDEGTGVRKRAIGSRAALASVEEQQSRPALLLVVRGVASLASVRATAFSAKR
jgi:hypothetical protein